MRLKRTGERMPPCGAPLLTLREVVAPPPGRSNLSVCKEVPDPITYERSAARAGKFVDHAVRRGHREGRVYVKAYKCFISLNMI